MTKQNKKTTNTKKATATKKAVENKKERIKTFLEYTQDGETILTALRKTTQARKLFLSSTYESGHFAELINAIANRFGYSKQNYNYLASYPLKAELAKIRTIGRFENKQRETLTPRMVAALVIAYLNRDENNTFSRVFPCGLFLENGCLTDLMTADYITSKTGTDEQQTFTITKKASFLFDSAEYKQLEKEMTQADAI